MRQCPTLYLKMVIYRLLVEKQPVLTIAESTGNDLATKINLSRPHPPTHSQWHRLLSVLRRWFCCCWFLVYCYCLTLFGGFCVRFLFWYIGICVIPRFAIISLRKRASWMFYFDCLLDGMRLLGLFGSSLGYYGLVCSVWLRRCWPCLHFSLPESRSNGIPMTVRLSTFSKNLLWNQCANWTQNFKSRFIRTGDESLFKWFWSHDQDGHNTHIWLNL